jgi:hypothetical protein
MCAMLYGQSDRNPPPACCTMWLSKRISVKMATQNTNNGQYQRGQILCPASIVMPPAMRVLRDRKPLRPDSRISRSNPILPTLKIDTNRTFRDSWSNSKAFWKLALVGFVPAQNWLQIGFRRSVPAITVRKQKSVFSKRPQFHIGKRRTSHHPIQRTPHEAVADPAAILPLEPKPAVSGKTDCQTNMRTNCKQSGTIEAAHAPVGLMRVHSRPKHGLTRTTSPSKLKWIM